MPEMTLTEAAKWAGKSRPTIYKAIKSGRLSARKREEDGEIRIDPSELERVYKPAASTSKDTGNSAVNGPIYTPAIASDIAEKEQIIAVQAREITLLRESLDDARQQRDKAMQTADRLTLLLQDQSQKPPVEPVKRGWFQLLTRSKPPG